MGQKISPISLRTGINKDWASRWFGGRKYVSYLKDDLQIRNFLDKRLKNMGIDRVDIERGADTLNIVIHTARPGLLIGRGGGGVEELKKLIQKLVKNKISIKLEIQEFKNAELSAKIMAESIADQTEKRIPYRRVLNQALSKIIANKQAKGAKVQVSGRLNGSEIARTEHLEE